MVRLRGHFFATEAGTAFLDNVRNSFRDVPIEVDKLRRTIRVFGSSLYRRVRAQQHPQEVQGGVRAEVVPYCARRAARQCA